MKYYLAVDIGASGGRHMLGSVADGRLTLREIYRFDNGMITKNGRLCWDAERMFSHITRGLQLCAELGMIPETMGIDTWGVDFALLDAQGERLGDIVAYRDARTDGTDALVEAVRPFAELYARTGIQKQPFNTIYQLMALKRDDPALLARAESLLLVPDYFGYLLTGVKKQEYTNATTTALVHAESRQWDTALLDTLGLPRKLFGALSMPKTVVGQFKQSVVQAVGFDCTVVLPATHDTGSAFVAVPAEADNSVFLSSGTWSLLGLEHDTPIATRASRRANFTNEGGFDGRYRFLKNIMGLWMIQSIRRELETEYDYPTLTQMAIEAVPIDSMIDVNDRCFLAPRHMAAEVNAFCARTNQPIPGTIGETLRVVYRSLAQCYAEAIRALSAITGKQFTRIHIVGGGCRDGYLNQLTANASGLPVYAGPTEGTALGNVVTQLLAAGAFENVKQARAAIRRSFKIEVYQPHGGQNGQSV